MKFQKSAASVTALKTKTWWPLTILTALLDTCMCGLISHDWNTSYGFEICQFCFECSCHNMSQKCRVEPSAWSEFPELISDNELSLLLNNCWSHRSSQMTNLKHVNSMYSYLSSITSIKSGWRWKRLSTFKAVIENANLTAYKIWE
jgi:hypothetical protein